MFRLEGFRVWGRGLRVSGLLGGSWVLEIRVVGGVTRLKSGDILVRVPKT